MCIRDRLKTIKIPKLILSIEEYNQQQWDKLVVKMAIKSTQSTPTQQDLDQRIALVDRRLPIPVEPVEPGVQMLSVDGVRSML